MHMRTSNNFHTRIVNKPNRNRHISADFYITFGALVRNALRDGTDEIFRCQLNKKHSFVKLRGRQQKKIRNVIQQSFIGFTIGEKLYTVVYQKYMKENVSIEISIQNKAEMSFQMEQHRTYFRTRLGGFICIRNRPSLKVWQCSRSLPLKLW